VSSGCASAQVTVNITLIDVGDGKYDSAVFLQQGSWAVTMWYASLRFSRARSASRRTAPAALSRDCTPALRRVPMLIDAIPRSDPIASAP